MTIVRRHLWGALITGLLAIATSATADPRWWWNDQQLIAASADATQPDIANVSGKPGHGERFYVVWQQADAAGNTHIELTYTPDGGCVWCEPMVLTSGPSDRAPSIAAVRARGGFQVQVAYESDSGIEVIASSRIPSPWGCAELRAATWTRPVPPIGGPVPRPGILVRPDLAAVARTGGCAPHFASLAHFHLVWEDRRNPRQTEIRYARDLAGDGTGWGEMFPLRDAATPVGSSYVAPSVAVDEVVGTSGESAVNVVFADRLTGQVLGYRSVDSGESFSADGSIPPLAPVGAPARISRPGASGAASVVPVNDSSLGECRGLQEEWHGVAWSDARSGTAWFDAQFHDAPSSTAVGFRRADHLLGAGADLDLALAVTHVQPTRDNRSEVWLAYAEASGSDLLYRPGLLGATASPPVDFSMHAAEPRRLVPPDPAALDGALLLTDCQWDDATGDCVRSRPEGDGDASDVALADQSPHDANEAPAIFAVWSDSRGGGARGLWYKRTDRYISPTGFDHDFTPTATCLSPTEARVDLQFYPVQGCSPTLAERLHRYLIYWGDAADGPFPHRVEVMAEGLAEPARVAVRGVTPGRSFWFVVVPEDQARNIWPARFDPGSGGNDGFRIDQRLLVSVPSCP